MEMRRFEKFFVNSWLINFIYKHTRYNSFLNFISKDIKGKLLEIGCGIGRTSHSLAEKYKNASITAIDYDKDQIEIANKNKKSLKIEFMQADATKLRFKPASFDYAIETNVLHHIKNYGDAIKETRRVLKKNGYFYLMDISQYVFTLPLIRYLFPPESYITKDILIKKLEESKFKIEGSKGRYIFFIAAKKVR
ncbi:class I SAM-dependent methyltransferase [Candidatus Woesearchaeota archaeon]|nr:class I SAM-dependent methyltransferase [Candidatus Woesearchaeota archaeon]